MTMAEMQRKIESLEKRVRELESRPAVVHHHHYTAPVIPLQAPDYQPWWVHPVTCLGVR